MDSSYVTALAALAGSVIGGLSSFATTWVIQHSKYRFDQIDKDKTRRETIYVAFIDEASKLFADALHHSIDDASKLVKLYSIVSRMRLFASSEILAEAEKTTDELVATYFAPNQSVSDLRDATANRMDPLRKFSDACRRELSAM